MYCSQCGTQVPDDAAFCHECGAKVLSAESEKEGTSAQVGPPTPQAAASTSAPHVAGPAAAVAAARRPAAGQVVIGIAVIVGAALAIIGCLLSWADLDVVAGNGFDVGFLTDPEDGDGQDGLFVLLIGLAAGGLGVHYFFGRNALASLAIVGLGVGAAVIGGYNLVKMVQWMQDFCDELGVDDCDAMQIIGEGIYLTIVGGAVIAVAGVVGLVRASGQHVGR